MIKKFPAIAGRAVGESPKSNFILRSSRAVRQIEKFPTIASGAAGESLKSNFSLHQHLLNLNLFHPHLLYLTLLPCPSRSIFLSLSKTSRVCFTVGRAIPVFFVMSPVLVSATDSKYFQIAICF